MAQRNRCVPTVERLEQVLLQTGLPATLAIFKPPSIVLDGSDTTSHTAWAFPGMNFVIDVNCPTKSPDNTRSYMGYSSVTYTFSPKILSSTTSYSTAIGQWSLINGRVTTATSPTGFGPQQDEQSFYLPKDPGTVILDIDMQARLYSPNSTAPPATEALHDQMILKIEAPTVSFKMASNFDPAQGAPGLWFGRIDPTTSGPDPAGGAIGFTMAWNGTNQKMKGWVGMWADVTNNTHYDLRIGFIQTVDTTRSASYTKGFAKTDADSNLLDWSNFSTFFYADTYFRVNKGRTDSLSPLTQSSAQDSPAFAVSPTDKDDPTSYLTSLLMQDDYHTSLSVAAGWVPFSQTGYGSQGVGGWPIALSTADWHLDGYASNNFNTSTPGAATATSTLDPNNWTYQLSSGSGPFSGQWPAANTPPPSRWTSGGDGVIKYLDWMGTTQGLLAGGTFAAINNYSATATPDASRFGSIGAPWQAGPNNLPASRKATNAKFFREYAWTTPILPPSLRETFADTLIGAARRLRPLRNRLTNT